MPDRAMVTVAAGLILAILGLFYLGTGYFTRAAAGSVPILLFGLFIVALAVGVLYWRL